MTRIIIGQKFMSHPGYHHATHLASKKKDSFSAVLFSWPVSDLPGPEVHGHIAMVYLSMVSTQCHGPWHMAHGIWPLARPPLNPELRPGVQGWPPEQSVRLLVML